MWITHRKGGGGIRQKIRDQLDYKVVKGNDLIQKTKSDLTIIEQKLIAYVISQIKPTDEQFQIYEIKISDFSKIIGTSAKSVYEDFRAIIDDLDDKACWIRVNGAYTKFRWFSESSYIEDKGTIHIMLNSMLKQYLMDLSKNFTSYELYNVMAFKSKYSMRLYELFKSYEYKSLIEFNIDCLKDLICATQYESYRDFNTRVLTKAIQEINQYTNLVIDHECIGEHGDVVEPKQGRRVCGLRFHITRKEPLDGYAAYLQVIKKLDKRVA